jgi:hypothetical protein
MKLLSRLWVCTGVAATIVTLLLSLPGPKISRADDVEVLTAVVVTEKASTSCESSTRLPATTIISVLPPAPGSSASQVIALNGAGYNSDRMVPTRPIERPAPPAAAP